MHHDRTKNSTVIHMVGSRWLQSAGPSVVHETHVGVSLVL